MKIVIAVLALVIMTSLVFAEEVIVKIAENNIEVRQVLYKDKAGKEPIIISRESYGQNRIDNEKETAQSNIDSINTQTAEDYKANALKAFTEHKAKLVKVQTAMDKEVILGN